MSITKSGGKIIASTISPFRRFQNNAMFGLISLATLITVIPLFAIFLYLLLQGFGSLFSDPIQFLTQAYKTADEGGGGIWHAIAGSLMMLGMALVIGVIVGIATGIFLSEYAEHLLAPLIRVMSDVLTGIPAIVVGLVVYVLLVGSKVFGGYNAIAGGVALGLIMVPVVVRATEEVLKLIPNTIREAGLALGLPRWKVILFIVLPSALSGLITGVALALARVSGEAAPLLFTALGNNYVNYDPTKPTAALPLLIYDYSKQPDPIFNQQIALAAALVLSTIIFAANLLARFVASRRA
jgi:phosphate transport system permease protein